MGSHRVRGGACTCIMGGDAQTTSVPAMRFASAFARTRHDRNLMSLHVSNVRNARPTRRWWWYGLTRAWRTMRAGGATWNDEADAAAKCAPPAVRTHDDVVAAAAARPDGHVRYDCRAVLPEPRVHDQARLDQPVCDGQRNPGRQRAPRNGRCGNGAVFAVAARGNGWRRSAVVFCGEHAQRRGDGDVFRPVFDAAAKVVGGDVDVQVSRGGCDANDRARGNARSVSQRGAGQVYCAGVPRPRGALDRCDGAVRATGAVTFGRAHKSANGASITMISGAK